MPLTIDKSGPKKHRKKRAKLSPSVPVAHNARIREARGTLSEERLLRPDGRLGRVLTLDANSATFTSDLTLMFEKNVAKARREHKRKADSASRGR